MSNETTLPELFYTITLTLSVVANVIIILFGCLIIFIILSNKPAHTIANLLTCNSGLCIISFEITMFASNIYGLRGDWVNYQPDCRFRAYCIVFFCAVIAYSYMIQAISRLFFITFYQYKKLQTYRTHFILIIINWCIGILILCTVHLTDNNVAILIPQFRFCALSFDSFIPSTFIGFAIFLIPFCFVITIYITIGVQIYRLKNRVQPVRLRANTKKNGLLPNMKRELKLVKVTLILWSCFACAGTPYFLIIISRSIFKVSLPEAYYLISINLIVINCGVVLTVVLIITDDLKKYLSEMIKKLCCVFSLY